MTTKEIKHTERDHALLSASSAHRWLICTPSARLEEQFPDTTSDYAREGTLAHEIAELKLRKQFTEPMSQSTYSRRLNKFKKHELYQEEMLKHTDTYLDYLREITIGMDVQPYVAVERQIDFSQVVPEGFGTVDCLIIGGDTLYITDFKYGKGVLVSAEDNPQMKLYALGAYFAYSFLYPIQIVKLAIVQPRLDSISEWEISAKDLLAWGEKIKPIAAKAFAGEGEFVPGEHCKFCRAKAQCRARAEMYTALSDFGMKKPPLLTNEEVGEILKQAQGLEAWVKALKEYALSACLEGEEIPGWKAVEGRSTRIYKDVDRAFEHLAKNGIDEALLYERVPLTVAKLEKALGKKEFNSLLVEKGLVEKTPGKPTIAPMSDKRPAITNKPSAAEDFQ
ncbi:DUF2800 domain-containing protein [Heyndrickxia faecalis]|uniref:DUF2800 domain-containing protein n=1 Tax=Heyndrickxia faecalis TaxID=2824910 RepID=UPI003D1C1D60